MPVLTPEALKVAAQERANEMPPALQAKVEEIATILNNPKLPVAKRMEITKQLREMAKYLVYKETGIHESKPSPLGIAKGQLTVNGDFDDTNTEIEALLGL